MLKNKNVCFYKLSRKAKIQYIYDYYKFPIILFAIIIYIIVYILYGHFTKKENYLYIGLVNVSMSDGTSEQLFDTYLISQNIDITNNQIVTYENLYLSSDPSTEDLQFAYTSSTRILAAIESKQLDLVFLNEEAFIQFEKKGYLYDLSLLLENNLSTSDSVYAIDVSNSLIIKDAQFNDTLYIGIVQNSPRIDEAVLYLEYLLD
ncbi:MAG: hypothetical protein ACRC7V_00470 [Lachnospiraceae bacterium]